MWLPIKRILLFSAPLFFIAAGPEQFNRVFIRAADEISRSVVNITVYEKYTDSGKTGYVETAVASGTVISSHGYVVTNRHVLEKGDHYRITGVNGVRYYIKPFSPSQSYLSDSKTDIALFQIDTSGGFDLVPVHFADSSLLTEGEWVMAVGNPFGLNMSVTAGIVSSRGRDNIGFSDIENFIQTDVSINPGNSGGPLINLNGNLVGINTAIKSFSGGYQGISFAIPSNIVKRVCHDLINYQRVRRGWIGLFARENRNEKNMDDPFVEIISVIKDSPAEAAGLRKGDIIKKIDSRPVNSLGTLVSEVGNRPTGTGILFTISRAGRIYEIDLILREKKEYEKIKQLNEYLFSEYGFQIDENMNNEVVVTYSSPAHAVRGLRSGDIILKLNDRHVSGINDFIKIFDKSRKALSIVSILRDDYVHHLNISKERFQ